VGAISTALGAGTSAAGLLSFTADAEFRTQSAAAGFARAADSITGEDVRTRLGRLARDVLLPEILSPMVLLSEDFLSKFV